VSRTALERRLAGLEAGSRGDVPAELPAWLGEAPGASVRPIVAGASEAVSDLNGWLNGRGERVGQ
jgi:hypothetical protein